MVASSASWWLTEVAVARSVKLANADSGTMMVGAVLSAWPLAGSRRAGLTGVAAVVLAFAPIPLLVAAALAGVVVLSGCQVASPIQTNVPYQPADGVAVDLGDVQIRDLVVVSGAKGEVGTLSGMVVNQGASRVTITFATGDSADPFVPGRSIMLLSPTPSAKRVVGEQWDRCHSVGESYKVCLPALPGTALSRAATNWIQKRPLDLRARPG